MPLRARDSIFFRGERETFFPHTTFMMALLKLDMEAVTEVVARLEQHPASVDVALLRRVVTALKYTEDTNALVLVAGLLSWLRIGIGIGIRTAKEDAARELGRGVIGAIRAFARTKACVCLDFVVEAIEVLKQRPSKPRVGVSPACRRLPSLRRKHPPKSNCISVEEHGLISDAARRLGRLFLKAKEQESAIKARILDACGSVMNWYHAENGEPYWCYVEEGWEDVLAECVSCPELHESFLRMAVDMNWHGVSASRQKAVLNVILDSVRTRLPVTETIVHQMAPECVLSFFMAALKAVRFNGSEVTNTLLALANFRDRDHWNVKTYSFTVIECASEIVKEHYLEDANVVRAYLMAVQRVVHLDHYRGNSAFSCMGAILTVHATNRRFKSLIGFMVRRCGNPTRHAPFSERVQLIRDSVADLELAPRQFSGTECDMTDILQTFGGEMWKNTDSKSALRDVTDIILVFEETFRFSQDLIFERTSSVATDTLRSVVALTLDRPWGPMVWQVYTSLLSRELFGPHKATFAWHWDVQKAIEDVLPNVANLPLGPAERVMTWMFECVHSFKLCRIPNPGSELAGRLRALSQQKLRLFWVNACVWQKVFQREKHEK